LAVLVGGDGVLDGLRGLPALVEIARSYPLPDLIARALVEIADRHTDDSLAAYLALHAASRVASPIVDEALLRLMRSEHPGLREHSAWALSRRRPLAPAVPHLTEMAENGGFGQMMAELTLENWLRQDPQLAAPRSAAGKPMAARLQLLAGQPEPIRPTTRRSPGLRIAQVLMQGKVDSRLTAAGAGDGGGLATLQVGLTGELADHHAVADTYLITRRLPDPDGVFDRTTERIGRRGKLARLDFGPSRYLSTSEMWPWRADLERALRHLFISEGPFDALHLRFADVGTFAAARAGRALGIPIYFTLAPDPHSVIASGERSGRISRGSFAADDLEHHYVFRAWLVEWMLEHARRLALIPRPDHTRQLRDLIGIDVTADPDRFQPIAEGVDFRASDRAVRQVEAAQNRLPLQGVLADLGSAVGCLQDGRRGLPLIVTAGRLHPIKGIDRLVEAWFTDPALQESFNLAVIGGDLADPSVEERRILDAIGTVLGGRTPEDAGLLMMGNRSHEDVGVLLAAVALGVPGLAAPNGIYACASDKEEFGLAIVEALAAGLPVVAPQVGGPGTYVDHGFTGYLADTLSIRNLQEALHWAEGARFSEVRADAGRRLVKTGYSLRAMADELVEFYQAGDLVEVAG
jgi:glycosyltransferase involved in cell wall biosynthesis